jgi:type I restriction enzyme S subunit
MDDITLPFVDRSIASYCVSKLDALKAGSKTLPPGCVIASCVGNFGVASINTVPVIINQQLQPTYRNKLTLGSCDILLYQVGLNAHSIIEVAIKASVLLYAQTDHYCPASEFRAIRTSISSG